MTTPRTRNVNEVIDALEIAIAEFGFHAERLKTLMHGHPNQNAHLNRLAHGYLNAAKHGDILRNYLVGRRLAAHQAYINGAPRI